ncbi:MAG: hypothetical protein ACYS8W_18600 [Planctomycetota bacterium]|jgi:membrane-bound ClpP family serine protease
MYYGIAFAMFLAGVGLIVAEIFIVSFGVLTIAAIGCFIGGCVFAFYAGSTFGFIFTLGNFIAVPALIYMIIKYLPQTGFGRHLIRTKPTPEEKTVATQIEQARRRCGIRRRTDRRRDRRRVSGIRYAGGSHRSNGKSSCSKTRGIIKTGQNP